MVPSLHYSFLFLGAKVPRKDIGGWNIDGGVMMFSALSSVERGALKANSRRRRHSTLQCSFPAEKEMNVDLMAPVITPKKVVPIGQRAGYIRCICLPPGGWRRFFRRNVAAGQQSFLSWRRRGRAPRSGARKRDRPRHIAKKRGVTSIEQDESIDLIKIPHDRGVALIKPLALRCRCSEAFPADEMNE
jgi:hypothetical protein